MRNNYETVINIALNSLKHDIIGGFISILDKFQ